jgi:beta-lactamase regulating signal transducer with metallopeptidase domain
MGAELFRVLANSTIATSVAVVLVSLLRRPVRIAAGARAAYWLWLLVPAMAVAVLLPAPQQVLFIRTVVLPEHASSVITAAVTGRVAPSGRTALIDFALAIWGAGFITAGVLTIRRQREFAPILSELIRDAGGFHRGNVPTPMLVGALHPKIVVPMDFELRYSTDEQELILAHERAHACRNDVAVNMLASLALCIYWFNPLIYRALAWLRMDQELACDAQVLIERGDARRRYAEALLKTQLATESAWRLAVGCHWQSIHPLKERVAMLKRPLPVRSRRLGGLAFITALTGVVTYTAWAAQPLVAPGPSILVGLSIRVSNTDAHSLAEYTTLYSVHSGEMIKDKNTGQPLLYVGHFAFGCTPYLPDAPGQSTDWSEQLAHGNSLPIAGEILLDCTIQEDGGTVQRASVITKDGEPAIIDAVDAGGSNHFHLQVHATAKEKTAAAILQSSILHN